MEKLGIEPIQLLLQAFNFAVMVIVLTKLLYNPILKALSERKRKIAEGLEFAGKMKIEEEKLEKKRQDIILKAKEEGKKIVDEVKKESKKISAEIIEKANIQAIQILQKGREDIEIQRAEMEGKLKDSTIEIATTMVTRLLSEALSPKDQKEIIDRKIKTITGKLK